MHRDCIKIRLFRAASGKTQERFADDMGSDPSSLAQRELGIHVPSPEQLRRAAEAAAVTLEWADEALELIERHQQQRQRPGLGTADLVAELAKVADASTSQLLPRLLSLPACPATRTARRPAGNCRASRSSPRPSEQPW